jgi:hypothetical protein
MGFWRGGIIMVGPAFRRLLVSSFFTFATLLSLETARADIVTFSFSGIVQQCTVASCTLGASVPLSITFDTSVSGVLQPGAPAGTNLTYFGAVTELTIDSFHFVSPTTINDINIYDNFFNNVVFLDLFGAGVGDGTLRVRPETLGRIAEFSEHEAD